MTSKKVVLLIALMLAACGDGREQPNLGPIRPANPNYQPQDEAQMAVPVQPVAATETQYPMQAAAVPVAPMPSAQPMAGMTSPQNPVHQPPMTRADAALPEPLNDNIGSEGFFETIPCPWACTDQTRVQTDYVKKRDFCQGTAEQRLPSYIRPDDRRVNQKTRNSQLLALFSECMHRQDWQVTGPKIDVATSPGTLAGVPNSEALVRYPQGTFPQGTGPNALPSVQPMTPAQAAPLPAERTPVQQAAPMQQVAPMQPMPVVPVQPVVPVEPVPVMPVVPVVPSDNSGQSSEVQPIVPVVPVVPMQPVTTGSAQYPENPTGAPAVPVILPPENAVPVMAVPAVPVDTKPVNVVPPTSAQQRKTLPPSRYTRRATDGSRKPVNW